MAFGFAWITFVSHLFFILWPTQIPALISGPEVTNPLLQMVRTVDTNFNACPSLHASLATYCALCCARLLKSRKQQAGVWLWAFLILAATLLAKRHVVLDLIAGGGARSCGLLWLAKMSSQPRSLRISNIKFEV